MIWTILGAIGLVVSMVILVCCKVSGDCSRQREKEEPCETCVRWEECNGVDDDCPIRR